jgi:Signal transduction histidine kinase
MPSLDPDPSAQPYERLRLLLDRFPVFLFETDATGRITHLEGSHLRRVTATPAEEWQGSLLTDLFPGAPQEVDQCLRTALRTGSAEQRVATPLHVWELSLQRIMSADEAPGSAMLRGVASNVTERERAESALGHRTRELSLLNTLLAEVNSSFDVDQAALALQRQLRQQFNAQGGALFLLDFNTFQPNREAAWGIPESVLGGVQETVLDMLSGAAEGTLDARVPQSLPSPVPDRSGAESRGGPLFYLPLQANEQLLGALLLYRADLASLRQHSAAFFDMLGRQIGVALQNARLYQRMQEGREQHRLLAHRIVEAQETERSYLARELHDEFGQVLTGLRLTLEMAAHPKADATKRSEAVARAQEIVVTLIQQVRDMSLRLRPNVLDDLGLVPALQWHLEKYQAQTGVTVDFQRAPELERLRFSTAVETAAFRIVQEALTNVARYAGVERALVKLEYDGSRIAVTVEDKGVGFSRDTPTTFSNGLSGMRERAQSIGGFLHLRSAPGEGTTVLAILPSPAL